MCMQNFWFVSSAVPEISRVPKFEKKVTSLRPHALFRNFSFFDLVSLTFNPRAKFELCILCRSRDIRGSLNLKSRSRDLSHAPFWTYFTFFGLVSLTLNPHAKFEVCIFSRSRASQNMKSRSRDHGHAPF